MIVISMILILVSMSIPAYNQSILRAKESVLRQDLFQLRSLISQYTLDKQKAPQATRRPGASGIHQADSDRSDDRQQRQLDGGTGRLGDVGGPAGTWHQRRAQRGGRYVERRHGLQQLVGRTSDLRPQTSDLRPQTPDLRPQTSRSDCVS